MVENINLMNAEATTHERLKVFAAQIVVSRNNPDKPVYGIIYYDIERKEWCRGFGSYDLKFVQQWFREELEVIEMDFEPVKHGRWIDTEPEYCDCYAKNAHVCSNCRDFYTLDWKYMKYCPNCGAKMDEVE